MDRLVIIKDRIWNYYLNYKGHEVWEKIIYTYTFIAGGLVFIYVLLLVTLLFINMYIDIIESMDNGNNVPLSQEEYIILKNNNDLFEKMIDKGICTIPLENKK